MSYHDDTTFAERHALTIVVALITAIGGAYIYSLMQVALAPLR